MRILGISLLRLGDIFIHLPALQSLKAQHPEAEIHILINKQFSFVHPLLHGVDVVHEFDRNLVQKSMTDPRFAITNAFSLVREQVSILNECGFDLVVNLTHNRLSALLAGRVEAGRHEGLTYQAGCYKLKGSGWWRELSHHGRSEAAFSFTQILDYAVGGSGMAKLEIATGKQARVEARPFRRRARTHISVQVQTSDPKKSLDHTKTHALLEHLGGQIGDIQFTLLCAPNEAQALEALVEGLGQEGIRVQMAPVSLAAALLIIEDSDLLISSDTSIKHLARAGSTPVLEIALGSSAPRETGMVRPGDYIVQSRELCSPCKHSESCYRKQRFCADRISARALAEISMAILAQDELRLLEVASRSRRNFRVFGSLSHSLGIHMYELEAGKVDAVQRLWDSEVWCTAHRGALPPESTCFTDGSVQSLMKRLGITAASLGALAQNLIAETEILEREVSRSVESLLHIGLSLKSAGSESLTPAELQSLMATLLGLTDSGNFLRYFRAKLGSLTEITPVAVSELRAVLAEVQMICRLRMIQLSTIVKKEEEATSVQY